MFLGPGWLSGSANSDRCGEDPRPLRRSVLMLKSIIANIANLLTRARNVRCRRKQRVMQICETLPLGERRFLLLVKVEEQKFLVGAAGNSISLLAKVSPSHDLQQFQIAEDNDESESQVCKSW